MQGGKQEYEGNHLKARCGAFQIVPHGSGIWSQAQNSADTVGFVLFFWKQVSIP